MISFDPTEEEAALQDVAHRFAAEQIRPMARTCEEGGAVTDDLVRAYWEIGLAGLGCPESCGGVALGARAQVLVEEELAWGDAGICAALPRPAAVGAVLAPLEDAVRTRWLTPLLADRALEGIPALFEPSPAAPWGLACVASAAPAGVAISGTKESVSGAERADWILLACVQSDEPVVAIVPIGTSGLRVSSATHQLGMRAARLATLYLDGVVVSQERVLATGQLAAVAIRSGVEHSLLCWTARIVGTARAAFEYAARYATQRTTFGKPIADHQAVGFMVADMGIRVDAARNLLWQAAWAVDTGAAEATELVCGAARFAAAGGGEVTSTAVQILGGHGYICDHPVEQWMRDARSAANVALDEAGFLQRITTRLSA